MNDENIKVTPGIGVTANNASTDDNTNGFEVIVYPVSGLFECYGIVFVQFLKDKIPPVAG
jgi:hypothetical protein